MIYHMVQVEEVCLKLGKGEVWEVSSPPHRAEPAAERSWRCRLWSGWPRPPRGSEYPRRWSEGRQQQLNTWTHNHPHHLLEMRRKPHIWGVFLHMEGVTWQEVMFHAVLLRFPLKHLTVSCQLPWIQMPALFICFLVTMVTTGGVVVLFPWCWCLKGESIKNLNHLTRIIHQIPPPS